MVLSNQRARYLAVVLVVVWFVVCTGIGGGGVAGVEGRLIDRSRRVLDAAADAETIDIDIGTNSDAEAAALGTGSAGSGPADEAEYPEDVLEYVSRMMEDAKFNTAVTAAVTAAAAKDPPEMPWAPLVQSSAISAADAKHVINRPELMGALDAPTENVIKYAIEKYTGMKLLTPDERKVARATYESWSESDKVIMKKCIRSVTRMFKPYPTISFEAEFGHLEVFSDAKGFTRNKDTVSLIASNKVLSPTPHGLPTAEFTADGHIVELKGSPVRCTWEPASQMLATFQCVQLAVEEAAVAQQNKPLPVGWLVPDKQKGNSGSSSGTESKTQSGGGDTSVFRLLTANSKLATFMPHMELMTTKQSWIKLDKVPTPVTGGSGSAADAKTNGNIRIPGIQINVDLPIMDFFLSSKFEHWKQVMKFPYEFDKKLLNACINAGKAVAGVGAESVIQPFVSFLFYQAMAEWYGRTEFQARQVERTTALKNFYMVLIHSSPAAVLTFLPVFMQHKIIGMYD